MVENRVLTERRKTKECNTSMVTLMQLAILSNMTKRKKIRRYAITKGSIYLCQGVK